MNRDETQHLTRIVERLRAINAKVQDLRDEAREVAETAWDLAGVRPKVVRLLAKEAAWDQVQREAQRQLEEALDECRAALGLLADLPLGQAAQAAKPVASDADHQGEKRGPGRPKGAKNKPKLATRDGADVPPPPDLPVPDVPDVPEPAAA